LEDGPNFLKSHSSSNNGFMLKLISFGPVYHSGQPPPQIQALLCFFQLVFAEPTSLPPTRAHDHQIILKSSQPINVCSYRYPYILKAEIEKLIRDMLHLGVIRPSHSPFSAPVLLVRKADGS
jgi:hypothetical protein